MKKLKNLTMKCERDTEKEREKLQKKKNFATI